MNFIAARNSIMVILFGLAVRHRINPQKSLFSSRKKTAQKVGTGTAQYSCSAWYDGHFFFPHIFFYSIAFFLFFSLTKWLQCTTASVCYNYGTVNARCARTRQNGGYNIPPYVGWVKMQVFVHQLGLGRVKTQPECVLAKLTRNQKLVDSSK